MALSKSALRRRYNSDLKRYERAEQELRRIVEETVEDLGDEYSVRPLPLVTGNVKEFDSFFDKACEYEIEGRVSSTEDCFREITDIARARVICQTLDDADRLQRLFDDNDDLFVDGLVTVEIHEPHGEDDTGYRACHFDVKVNVREGTAIIATPCELQVVTALQFAWSLYSHKDFYKGENVPELTADLMKDLSDLLNVADKLANRLIRTVEAA